MRQDRTSPEASIRRHGPLPARLACRSFCGQTGWIADALYVLSLCLVFWLFVGGFAWFIRVEDYPDYEHYLAMTAGEAESVPEPFASRILGPSLAGMAARLFGLPPVTALAMVVALAWALVPVFIGCFLRADDLPFRWGLALVTLPAPLLAASYYLVPDSWAVLCTLAFLWAERQRDAVSAFASCSAAILARSTAAAPLTLWVLAGWRRRRIWVPMAVALGILAGFMVLRMVQDGQQTNVHHMNMALYFLLKIPTNFVRNLFGMELYTNTWGWCSTPFFKIGVQGLPGLGRIKEVGLCPVNLHSVLWSLACYAGIFGLFPLLLCRDLLSGDKDSHLAALRARFRSDARPFVFLLFFLLAAGLGSTMNRMFVESYALLIPLATAVAARRAGDDALPVWLCLYNLFGLCLIWALTK